MLGLINLSQIGQREMKLIKISVTSWITVFVKALIKDFNSIS